MPHDDDDDTSSTSVPYKLTVVARSDLRMTAGKLASQVGHAVHDAVKESAASKISAWEEDGSMIVVLQVDGEAALRAVMDASKAGKIGTFPVIDEGLTEVEDGETTAVAVGPDEVQHVDAITGRLQLYSSSAETELEVLRRRLQETEAELNIYRAKDGTGPRASPSAAGGDLAPLPALREGEVWFVCDVQPVEGDQYLDPGNIPDFFELWTWEGDQTILPLKWTRALAAGYGDKDLALGGTAALRPWDRRGFDEEGIFFLTHRSDTCGVAAALAAKPADGSADAPVGFIAGLCVHPDYRRKGLGRCLLSACLRRHAELGRRRVFCAVDAGKSAAGFKLLTEEGFRKC